MRMKARIEERLRVGLQPNRLSVIDESHLHAGHAGARPQGESHFRVAIESAAFVGKSRLQRHRQVYDLLAQEIADGVHAIGLHTTAPGE